MVISNDYPKWFTKELIDVIFQSKISHKIYEIIRNISDYIKHRDLDEKNV